MRKTILSILSLTILFYSGISFAKADQAQLFNVVTQKVLNNINAYRFEHGLSPLKLNPYLSKVASSHSQNMAIRIVSFGHSGFQERMREIFSHVNYSRAFAENVAYTGGPLKFVISGWLSSPGHRKNILGNYNLTGIGSAIDREGNLYVTQIFLRADPQQRLRAGVDGLRSKLSNAISSLSKRFRH